jgi:hypothetical protein
MNGRGQGRLCSGRSSLARPPYLLRLAASAPRPKASSVSEAGSGVFAAAPSGDRGSPVPVSPGWLCIVSSIQLLKAEMRVKAAVSL